MREFTNEQLKPFAVALKPLQGMAYASAMQSEGWRQLAIVLAEESADPAHAKRIVEAFTRTPRYADGQLKTDVPSSIELRLFARGVPKADTGAAPEACGLCADFPGWRPAEKNGCDYRRICTCERGRWQAAANGAREVSGDKGRL